MSESLEGVLIGSMSSVHRHHCEPPGRRNAFCAPGEPAVLVSANVNGALWRCPDCGQFWRGAGHVWSKISDRKARRLL